MKFKFEWQIYYKNSPLGLCVVEQEFNTHLEALRFAHRLREVIKIDSRIRIVQNLGEEETYI